MRHFYTGDCVDFSGLFGMNMNDLIFVNLIGKNLSVSDEQLSHFFFSFDDVNFLELPDNSC